MAKKQANICVIPGGSSSEWLQVPADAFARLKRLLNWDAKLYLAPSEFARVFQIGYAEKSFTGPETVIAHLIVRLQHAGAAYKRSGYYAICGNCGLYNPGNLQCSHCGGAIVQAEREGYYLRVQRFGQEILNLAAEENLVLPPYQRGYVLNSISNLKEDDVLMALRVTRAKHKYLPTQWFGALAAVLSGCGYPGDEGGFQRAWAYAYFYFPQDLYSYIFYWCGVFLALNLPKPGGLVCLSSAKILDRRQQEVSPLLLAQNYGQESIRYLLLAVKTASGDNIFPENQAIQRINHDLANELGNLVSRVISMVSRYAGEMVPLPNILTRQNADLELRERALETPQKVEKYISCQEFSQAIRAIKNLVGAANRFIVTTAPWQLASTGNQQERLNTVLYNICEALRFIAVTLKPIMPEAAQSILGQLGLDAIPVLSSWSSLEQWGLLPVGTKIFQRPALFPRIVPGYSGAGPEQDLILREELARISMVVARILSAEAVADYEGLLHLILYDGRQRCSVLAPVARVYKPAALEGKKVILLSNLRPTEEEGLPSEGEVLVLEKETGDLDLIFVDEDIAEGSKVLCLS